MDAHRIPLPRRTTHPAREASVTPLQRWEGTVEFVHGDGKVTATLRDVGSGAVRLAPCRHLRSDDRLVVLSCEDFPDGIDNGYVFEWVIGYRVTPSGAKERYSRICFHRDRPLPKSRQHNVAREAERLAATFGEGATS